MDWDGTQQEDLCKAKSVISGCLTLGVSIAIYFLPSTDYFLWNTPQISCLLSIDCYYPFGIMTTTVE
jgi:hypothetical protein